MKWTTYSDQNIVRWKALTTELYITTFISVELKWKTINLKYNLNWTKTEQYFLLQVHI
jgi:hypothetical protein